MINVFYYNDKQRNKLIKFYEAQGQTMTHDNFLQDKKELVFDVLSIVEDPEFILKKLLLGKLQNNTITFKQLKTLIRLEHGYELTQTTRDIILIAVQGSIGGLIDRIRNAFNL